MRRRRRGIDPSGLAPVSRPPSIGGGEVLFDHGGGVGGFLGLGEKDVAFTMDRLTMTETDGGIKLSIDATSEELADAEAFKTVKVQKVEADADRARMEQENRATGSAVPNPANPPASAPTQAQ